MKKIKKILLWTLAIITSLVLLTLIGIQLFFPMDKAKDYALNKATQMLGREVTIENVNVSFKGGLGLRLEDVMVGNPAGFSSPGPDEPFLRSESIDLKVAIKPLLKGQVRSHSLVINHPVIHISTLADGSNNFTFAPIDSTPDAPAQGAASETETAPVSASIDQISLNQGEIYFHDGPSRSQGRIMGLKIRSSLANPSDQNFDIQGSLETESLHWSGSPYLPQLNPKLDFIAHYDQGSGQANLENLNLQIGSIILKMTGLLKGQGDEMQATARVWSESITIDQILAFVPAEALAGMKDITVQGGLALDCDVDFAASRTEPLTYKGTVNATDLTMQKQGIEPEVQVEQALLAFRPDYLLVDPLLGSAGGESFSGKIEVWDFANPRLEGQLDGAVSLDLAESFLDPNLKIKLGGRTEFKTQFTGSLDAPEQMKYSGRMKAGGVHINSVSLPEPITSLDAEITFNQDRIVVDNLAARTPSSDFSIVGTLQDPFPYFLPAELKGDQPDVPTPNLDFTWKSQKLNVDKLFPPASPGAVAVGADSAPQAEAPPLFQFPEMTGTGTVAIDTLLYSRVEFTDVKSPVEISQQSINCPDATAQVYTGGISGWTKIDLQDLENPGYSGHFSAHQIEIDDFLSRFSSFGGYFFGKLDLDGGFSAAGRKPEAIMSSLSLDSRAGMNQGKVVTTGFALEALNSVASLAGQSLDAEQSLKNLSASLRAENGRVMVDQLATGLGGLGDLSLGGSYGMAGDMKFEGTILLSEDQTQKLFQAGGLGGQVAGLLGSDTTRLTLPLTLAGSLQKPQLKVDTSSLTQAIQNNLEDGLKDELNRKLKDLFR